MQKKSTPQALQFDVLIVGSGLAGLSTALLLSEKYRVAIITKRAVREGSSGWAQGGIAAVWDKADSFAAHVDDTLIAGAGLCDMAATQFVVEQAPQAIAWLQAMGVPFSTEHNGDLHLTREGGHSARRIVHVTDATGAAVQATLIERVQKSPNISLFENHTLVDLITSDKVAGDKGTDRRCVGLYALDEVTDEVLTFSAPHTLLAPAAQARSIFTPPTPTPPRATALPQPGARAAGCRTWNSSSSTRPACTTRTPNRS
jgi:L-aspartate oxidase